MDSILGQYKVPNGLLGSSQTNKPNIFIALGRSSGDMVPPLSPVSKDLKTAVTFSSSLSVNMSGWFVTFSVTYIMNENYNKSVSIVMTTT